MSVLSFAGVFAKAFLYRQRCFLMVSLIDFELISPKPFRIIKFYFVQYTIHITEVDFWPKVPKIFGCRPWKRQK